MWSRIDLGSMTASMPSQAPSPKSQSPLADPAIRRLLLDYVRRRVPAPDVDDVVQTILVDALASPARPSNEEELRKWVLGIARHKVVDHHRKALREPPAELPEIEAGPEPLEARSMARWAEEQASSTGEAQKTLSWMAREGEGEKLESIAEEENVPAARVRQRVSRMRRWMKERWLAELAAVAVIAAAALVAWRLLRREEPEARPEKPPVPSILPEAPTPLERARQVRADALRRCEQQAWRACLDGLDEAARLDPQSDSAPGVAEAREKANAALTEPTAPAPSSNSSSPPVIPSVPPSSTSAPPPVTATPSSRPIQKEAPLPTSTSLSKPKPAPPPTVTAPTKGTPFSSEKLGGKKGKSSMEPDLSDSK